MKNKLINIAILGFLLLGLWTFSTGYFMGGTIRSPEGMMLVGIEMVLFSFILFIGFIVIFEKKGEKHDNA